ncbi:MAG: type IV secretory system conjugative DNA transfer family protein [Proteobacteria bacterium]|nr:type IV secretory system conjugative DNA transfer family protein [Pseudomonadota bacterium]
MFDRARLITAAAIALGVLVFSFAWSAALYVLLGFSIEAVRPWSVFQYLSYYGFNGGDANPVAIAFFVACVVGAVTGGGLWLSRPKKYYGDARWAYRREIRKARLLDDEGILLGRLGNTYLRNNEAGHVLVVAPTRSGKGVGIVIPNLLSWPGSVVVLDIKHENHQITSGFRAQHQRVFKWSPADDEGLSHRFNPLSTVRPDRSHRISDIQRLATILLPHPPHADPMWQNEARDLFLGLTLYVLDDPEQVATIGQIYRILKSEEDITTVLECVLNNDELTLDASARLSLASFLNKAPKERSGVRSNLTAALNLWANPVIDAATSESDFDLAELRRRPTSIYVAVKQNQLTTLSPLLGLFFQQCVDVLGRDLPGADEPHQVLLLIDEFASLGRLAVIESAMAFLAGYGVRLLNIIQGLSQLDHHYGQARDSILQNSSVQIFFAANDDATTRYVAARLGTKTIRTASRSDPGGFGWATKTSGYAARDLMLPEEVRQLKSSKQIVFKEGARPAIATKICYFRDRALKRRLLPPAPVPKLDLSVGNIGTAGNYRPTDKTTDRPDNDSTSELAADPSTEEVPLKEIEAMGIEIMALMANEPSADAQSARDQLAAVLKEGSER